MTNRRIVYIGNDLAKRSKYNSMMETLSTYLENEGFMLIKSSSKKNVLLRLIAMLTTVIKYRKADYILIDTFSTLNFYYALVISQLSRILKIPYIPILHGGNLPNRLKKNSYYSKLIFNNSYLNVAPSNYLKKEFEKYDYEVLFIPNVIPIVSYDFKKRDILFPKLLWVRAFHDTYNPTLAVKVLGMLKKTYPEARLCMIGPEKDNSYSQTLDLIEKMNLKESVLITGVLPKEEWHEKSKEYDILINTTNIDNTPVSIIEAMPLGLTIVSTNVGGIPFLIDHKEEGILVPKNNPKEMTDAIIALLTAPFDHQDMIYKARKKAERFDWSIVRNEWLRILK